jgi:hypothetical protein
MTELREQALLCVRILSCRVSYADSEIFPVAYETSACGIRRWMPVALL